MGKYAYTVPPEEAGLTLNQILKRHFRFSARFRTKIKYQALLDLNGQPVPGYVRPEAGDLIAVRLPREENTFPPEVIPVHPLYEDDDLLILNKQAGIIVHPTKGHPAHTLANGLAQYLVDTGQAFKIRFANRIDMDTSGIVVVAKNGNAQDSLSRQMQAGQVQKEYLAIVHGVLPGEAFSIDAPIGRRDDRSPRRAVLAEGGKAALTDVRVLERWTNASYVRLRLHTGRTHQIRVHLSYIGHPILGDSLYGGDAPSLMARQALHASHIRFAHPLTNAPLEVTAPLPPDMEDCLRRLRAQG